MHARILIESEIAATASQTISDEQLQELEEAVNKMEDDVAHERQNVSNEDDGDLLFHSRLASATGNMVLVSIVDQLWEGMRRPIVQDHLRAGKTADQRATGRCRPPGHFGAFARPRFRGLTQCHAPSPGTGERHAL